MTPQWRKHIFVSFLCLVGPFHQESEADTLSRMRESSTLKLGYSPNSAPFSFNINGKPAGYMIDVCQRIAERIKAQSRIIDLAVSFVEIPKGDGVGEVREGKVDLMCTPSVETLSARKFVSYTIPVFTAGLTALVRKDAPGDLLHTLNAKVPNFGPTWRATITRGLSNHSYAVLAGSITEKWIHERINTLGLNATVVTVENYAAGVDLISQKKVSAFFADRMALLSYTLKSSAADEVQVVDALYEVMPVAMVVDRQDEDFRLMVDSSLSDLYRSGSISKLYTSYFGEPTDVNRMMFKLYALP